MVLFLEVYKWFLLNQLFVRSSGKLVIRKEIPCVPQVQQAFSAFTNTADFITYTLVHSVLLLSPARLGIVFDAHVTGNQLGPHIHGTRSGSVQSNEPVNTC